MARAGRYRYTPVALWRRFHDAGVSANARLLYLALATGSGSSFAGIGPYYVERLANETGLSPAEIEAGFTELEKRPTPPRSFLERDRQRGIVWIRDFLQDDPARDKDPQILNETHRKGIQTILGELPKDSTVVKNFRKYYHFPRRTPTRGPAGGMGGGPEVPTTDFRPPTTDNQPPTAREGFSGPRSKDSTGAIQGWESVLQAIRARVSAPEFKDPHVAKIVRVMGGVGQYLHLNNRDVPAAEVNSARRRFLDLYDSTAKDPAEVQP